MIINTQNLGHCVVVYFTNGVFSKLAEGHILLTRRWKLSCLCSAPNVSENQPVYSRYQTGNDRLEPLVRLSFMWVDGVNV